ncbi:MAG: hypothetical protein HYT87_03415 [Nitrospirae bacterium]|nr:hypothetical protein [Nitrospirota bacterium]
MATYFLAPRDWAPSESWKYWASARILRETGGFPVFSHGPLHAVYLQAFFFLPYPWSELLEYLLTHLFAAFALFLMLRNVLTPLYALLLVIAWIPTLAIVEGGGLVASIGFVALYFAGGWGRARSDTEIIPWSLLAAVLCHLGAVPFLAGHFLGVVVGRLSRRREVEADALLPTRHASLRLAAKVGLGAVALLAALFPSDRWDHNHMLVDTTYAPMAARGALTIGFFQVGNWFYTTRTTPPSSWLDRDWYFTNQEAFGGATTILEALRKAPGKVAAHILQNVPEFLNLPMKFFFGRGPYFFGESVLAAVFWLCLCVSTAAIVHELRTRGRLATLGSIFFGAAGVSASLLLVWFDTRYVMALLPVGLLVVAHTGRGLAWVAAYSRGSFFKRPADSDRNLSTASARKKAVAWCGWAVLLMGIIFNEWVLSALWSADGSLADVTKWKIRALQTLALGGALLMIPGQSLLASWLRGGERTYTRWVVLVSACLVLPNGYGSSHGGCSGQMRAVISGPSDILQAGPGISMRTSYRELLAAASHHPKIILREETWLKAFTPVDIDGIVSPTSLPPFPDSSGRTEERLASMDAIWVSDGWANIDGSPVRQGFLRYRLHVEPFLRKALAAGWTEQVVAGYGRLYMRPKPLVPD